MRGHLQWIKLGFVAVLAACEPSLGRVDSPEPSAETVEKRPGPSRQRGDEILIAFLGDSLSAGLGVGEDEAFPKIVETRLRELGWKVEVINAGVSGDTSAGGVSRLSWLLRQEPEIVVVELGANDGLRGLSVEMTKANLREIVSVSTAAGAEVLLLGMRVPPNYGSDYERRFADIFPSLAEDLGVPLVPFLLEGVAADPELNLADGIHPNGEGHRRLAATVVPYLETMLERLQLSGPPPGP